MNQKQKKLFILAILTSFFIIFIVGAIQITTFTNGLSSENLTFTTNENITRNLTIYKNADVTSGYLNLSGYIEETDEFVGNNISILISDITGNEPFPFAGTEEYNWTGMLQESEYMCGTKTAGVTVLNFSIDVNSSEEVTLLYSWAGLYQCTTRVITNISIYNFTSASWINNYASNDSGVIGSGSIAGAQWGYANISIPLNNNLINSDKINLSVKIDMSFPYCIAAVWCRGVNFVYSKWGSFKFILENHPNNPYLEIGSPDGTYEWNYTGGFSSIEKTSDFSSVLNTALNSGACDCTSCSLSGNNCTIPFLFHSDTLGNLEYSAIDINYIPAPFVNLISPGNNTASSKIKTFNCSATDEIQLTNITFNFWNSTGDLNLSITKNLTGTSNSTTYEMTFNSTDTYYWNCEATNNNSRSWWADNNYTLNVDIDNPAITLNKPTDEQYINTQNVQFNYTPEHSTQTVDTCELWGNFTGTWALNQTDSSITEDVINSFNQTLSEDINYLWNIKCNTTETGNSAFAHSNFTFIIDIINPTLTITQPTGTQTSKTVSYDVSASDDWEMNTCIYWVMKGASEEISNTTVTCNSTMTGNFVVSSDLTSYVFHFFINDSAGNSNSSSSTFSVDTTAISGGGSTDDEDEEEITESICVPFKTAFLQAWEKVKQEENIWEKIKIIWNSWWNYILCSSAASIIPI